MAKSLVQKKEPIQREEAFHPVGPKKHKNPIKMNSLWESKMWKFFWALKHRLCYKILQIAAEFEDYFIMKTCEDTDFLKYLYQFFKNKIEQNIDTTQISCKKWGWVNVSIRIPGVMFYNGKTWKNPSDRNLQVGSYRSFGDWWPTSCLHFALFGATWRLDKLGTVHVGDLFVGVS